MRYGKIYRRMAGGPRQRINLLRHFITALVKYERIEAPYAKAHETQKYAERLIRIAKRGDTDQEAMKIADYWLYDKRQVHKLFKVLVPRFEERGGDFTQLLRVPGHQGTNNIQTAFLEFNGNPYPPLRQDRRRNPDWLLNVLVREALRDLKSAGVSTSSTVPATRGEPAAPEAATPTDSGEMGQLETAMDRVHLGSSNEGTLDRGRTDLQKDGTPV